MVMGAGIKCYATMLHSELRREEDIKELLIQTAARLSECGVKVTRRKMERVLFDDKQKACDGSCCAL